MKYLDEYRDPEAAQRFAAAIARITTRPWTLMEVCGGQTHAIVRYGIDELLPPEITLVHGPGCPVCVTPVDYVDKAIEIAGRPGTIFCSFGDMLRVPGSDGDLLAAKARGGDVRIVYSPLDALAVARAESASARSSSSPSASRPPRPANAMAVYQAKREGLRNFSHARLARPRAAGDARDPVAPTNRVQGFLAAGHVCTIMGFEEYGPLAGAVPRADRRHRLRAARHPGGRLSLRPAARRRAARRSRTSTAASVRREGNRTGAGDHARGLPGRAAGAGAASARSPKAASASPTPTALSTPRRASARSVPHGRVASECISGLVLCGEKKPHECPAFGTRCTPEHPLGVTMVSSEGACAAYYRYRGVRAVAAE